MNDNKKQKTTYKPEYGRYIGTCTQCQAFYMPCHHSKKKPTCDNCHANLANQQCINIKSHVSLQEINFCNEQCQLS